MGLNEIVGVTLQKVKESYHRNIIPGNESSEFIQFKDQVYKGECVAIPLNSFCEREPDFRCVDYFGYFNGKEIGRFRFSWTGKFEKSFHVQRIIQDNSFIVTEEKFYNQIDPNHP